MCVMKSVYIPSTKKIISFLAFGVTSLSLLQRSAACSSWRTASSAQQSPTCPAPARMAPTLEAAKAEALWGLFIGDSLAMPVHWYYNPTDIKRGYGGWLTGYRAPNDKHPSSILKLSSTSGSGRTGGGKESKQIIGSVILHDKLKYWKGSHSVHYHQGMKAGDSTLNALTVLETVKVFQREDPHHELDLRTLQAKVMENYIKFMTTPGSHNDTYAESFHRLFFKDWSSLDNPPTKGEDIVKMAEDRYRKVTVDSEDHQIAVIGSLVLVVPWVLHFAHKSPDECASAAVLSLQLTHPAPSLEPYIDAYARLLHAVLNGASLKEKGLEILEGSAIGNSRKKKLIEKIIEEAAQYGDTESRLLLFQEATSILGSACYIDGAMSSMLTLAVNFHDDFSAGVLTNANCGGENAHRGAALGALLGASAANKGSGIPSKWKDGLNSAKEDIKKAVSQQI